MISSCIPSDAIRLLPLLTRANLIIIARVKHQIVAGGKEKSDILNATAQMMRILRQK